MECNYIKLKNLNTGEIIEVFGENQPKCFVTRPDQLMYDWTVWQPATQEDFDILGKDHRLVEKVIRKLSNENKAKLILKNYNNLFLDNLLIGVFKDDLDKLICQCVESNIEVEKWKYQKKEKKH